MALKDTHQIDKETEEVVDPLLQYVYERYNLMFLLSLIAMTKWPRQCIHILPLGVFSSINDLPRLLNLTSFLSPAVKAIGCLYLEAPVLLCEFVVFFCGCFNILSIYPTRNIFKVK